MLLTINTYINSHWCSIHIPHYVLKHMAAILYPTCVPILNINSHQLILSTHYWLLFIQDSYFSLERIVLLLSAVVLFVLLLLCVNVSFVLTKVIHSIILCSEMEFVLDLRVTFVLVSPRASCSLYHSLLHTRHGGHSHRHWQSKSLFISSIVTVEPYFLSGHLWARE